ncbi:MAG TPA: TOMM precursor leader peptide-binding protein [Solirubrobacterales bacterium]|jgi:bacteriocin biosynthesis cyclodehydratase domain-containing protein|nr:TOMM precursor leader peptide-binding protein [Solirubrobacterales bacterium]
MRRPRIKRTTEPVDAPNGDLLLLRPNTSSAIEIGQPSDDDRRLLAALDGEHTLEGLQDEFGAKLVDETLAQLRELEVIEDAADYDQLAPGELARFDRQLRYFSDMGGTETTPSERQRRLREAKVAVLGVGGLGTWCAWSLACCGVGEMWLIDGDTVEVSNLNRQIFFTEADIGAPKAQVGAERLRAFNSSMRVTATTRRLGSQVEIADFVAGADVVIDAADWPAHDIERWCNAACFELGIPYITMSHYPPIARVGPLYVPGRTGCYSCQEIAYRREYPLYDETVEQLRALPSPAATLGPACGLIGGQVGMEVVHLLTGLSQPSTLGLAHIYDLMTMEVKREPVVAEPECPICAHLQPAERVKETAAG